MYRTVALLALGIGPSACSFAVRAIGTVTPGDQGMEIRSSEGKTRVLELEGSSRPIRYLNGHLVELEGRLHRGAIAVEEWRVVEGLHGLSVWVGQLEERQGGLAIADLDSGATYSLDPGVTLDLKPWVGQVLLVEGYVESTLGIHVMYYRPLFDEGRSAR